MSRIVAPSETRTEMTWIILPSQTNALGTAFGGQVMAWIDICGAVSAQRFVRGDVVTASMDSLSFLNPIKQGQTAVLRAMVNWAGTTSMEVGVRVEAEDRYTGQRLHTASAYLTFVAISPSGGKVAVPTLRPETALERQRWEEADERRRQRLEARAAQRERRRLAGTSDGEPPR